MKISNSEIANNGFVPMTIEEMKQRKQELGYSNQTLAEKSGVPIGTLQKIFAGATKYPREETIQALEHGGPFYGTRIGEARNAVKRL